MNIVLFSYNSSFTHTNLAIRCLRDALLEYSHSVTLIERCEKDSYEEVLYSLYEKNADMYGFSCYIWNISATKRLAQDLKALLPDTRIVFGGPEVSFWDEEFLLHHPYVDSLIRGEGEDAIVSLASSFRCGITDGGQYSDFLKSSIHYNSSDDLDHSIVYYESSRGCPYKCSYCLSGAEGSLRMKSVEKTLSDLLEFEKFDGIKIIKLVDRTFNADKKRAYAIWEALLSDKYTKSYHFEVCASLIDDSTVELLSKFPVGKIQLEIGVQSTNPTVLSAINRHDDPEKVISVTQKLHSLGNIHIHADLIAGLPLEDLSSIERSFDMLFGKCDMLQLGFLKLLKGSPLEKDKEKYGYVFSKEPPYRVLSNDHLSQKDLYFLERVEKALDRFSSGAFERSISYLTENITPFKLFSLLSEEASEIKKLSQISAYKLLYYFAKKHGIESDSFKDALGLDFLLSESHSLPDEFSLTKVDDKELRARFLALNRDFSVKSLEVYETHSDNEKLLFIDRRAGLYKIISRNEI